MKLLLQRSPGKLWVSILLGLLVFEGVAGQSAHHSRRQKTLHASAQSKKQNPTDAPGTAGTEKPLGESPVVVTGNPGVARFSTSLIDNLPLLSRNDINVICFSVRALADPVGSSSITSTGLGNSEFGLIDVGTACPAKAPRGTATLALPALRADSDVRLWMSFPREIIVNTGDSVDGKILVIVPQKKNLEVPLKVQAPSWSPLFTALLWSVGVIIPATITFLLGFQGNILFGKWQVRSAEFGKLTTYVAENHQALQDVLTIHLLTVLKNRDADFPENMRKALHDDVWAVIPAREAQELRLAIARCQRVVVKKKLAELFPEWGQAIDGRTTGRLTRYLLNIRQRLR
jgi:hypothetical protein